MKEARFGPIALTNSYTTNILQPAAAGAGTGYTPTASQIILTHISIVNKSVSAVSFRLFLGASAANAAGTEVVGFDKAIPAGETFHWYGRMLMNTGDYLVGGASASTSLTFEAEGEIRLA